VQEAALKAYKAAGVEVYGRVDVLLREEDGAPFVLEINTIPGMTPSSLLPKAAAASGWPYEDLCEKIAELSLVTPRK
nr:D-alanine--D-alanine ligase [Akkermansia sp.]